MVRLSPDHRRHQLLRASYDVALKDGLYHLSFTEVARRCGCSRALLTHYFKSHARLRALVIDRAIKAADVYILFQALAARDPLVSSLPKPVKDKIIAHIRGIK